MEPGPPAFKHSIIELYPSLDCFKSNYRDIVVHLSYPYGVSPEVRLPGQRTLMQFRLSFEGPSSSPGKWRKLTFLRMHVSTWRAIAPSVDRFREALGAHTAGR
jgi:hypothetical protein